MSVYVIEILFRVLFIRKIILVVDLLRYIMSFVLFLCIRNEAIWLIEFNEWVVHTSSCKQFPLWCNTISCEINYVIHGKDTDPFFFAKAVLNRIRKYWFPIVKIMSVIFFHQNCPLTRVFRFLQLNVSCLRCRDQSWSSRLYSDLQSFILSNTSLMGPERQTQTDIVFHTKYSEHFVIQNLDKFAIIKGW